MAGKKCDDEMEFPGRGTVDIEFDGDPILVRMRGEHDPSTAGLVAAGLTQAIDATEGDVVIDLGGVTFMDASTIGCLARGQLRLEKCDRSLTVRCPSTAQRKLLEICQMTYLIDRQSSRGRRASALESWVEIPVTPRLTTDHAEEERQPIGNVMVRGSSGPPDPPR